MASNTVGTRFKCDFFKLIDIFFPFLSISTTFLRADARARGQLQFVRINPVTIFLPLDFAFQQFAISSAPGTRADMFERASFTNPNSNSDLYQYLQLSGLYPPRILNGTKFLPTRLSGESCGVTGGAKLKVFRDSKSFWIQTGFGRVSNVIIPDILFADGHGVLHIIDLPARLPHSLVNTAIVLDNTFMKLFVQLSHFYRPGVETANDVTIFAVQNSAFEKGLVQPVGRCPPMNKTMIAQWKEIQRYVIVGQVVYSTDMRTMQLPMEGPKFSVRVSPGDIWVNERRVVQRDIPIRNGVLHVIDSVFAPLGPGQTAAVSSGLEREWWWNVPR